MALKGLDSGVYERVWEMVMRRKVRHKGSDDVLADLGFDDAEELSMKAILAVNLDELIEGRAASPR